MHSAAAQLGRWDQVKALYKVGVPLSKQASAIGSFTQGAFTTMGLYLLGPVFGWTSAQTFGFYALAYTAYILKLVLLDGTGLFNPVGGVVWAAIFGGAGALALK